MARMGTRKTFLMRPAEPKVVLPTYFLGLDTLTYENRADGDTVAGTGAACAQIRDTLGRLDADVFHSDLPAIGLAHGYFFNFVNAIYTTFREPQEFAMDGRSQRWEPDHGYTLTIIIPDTLMNRDAADQFLTKGALAARNILLRLRDGRDVSVYALPRAKLRTPLHMFDIPTTLVTSAEVIDRVDSFWGAGDLAFKAELARREKDSFERRLREMTERTHIDPERAKIVREPELAAHMVSLRRRSAPRRHG
jgi:hypothetical protein